MWSVLLCVVFLPGTDCCWATRHPLSRSWLQSPDALRCRFCREERSFPLAIILPVGFWSRVLVCETVSLETVYCHKLCLWVGRPLFSGPGMSDILTWNSLPSQSVPVGRLVANISDITTFDLIADLKSDEAEHNLYTCIDCLLIRFAALFCWLKNHKWSNGSPLLTIDIITTRKS